MNKLTDKNFKYLDNYLLEGACYSFLIKKTSSKGGKIMKRKFLSVLLAGALAVSMLAGCGGGNDAAETTTETTDTAETDAAETDTADADAAETDASAGGGLVGVSMPTQDLQRWNQDGSNMKAELEAAGYTVELQYASNDIATQVSQIETMIHQRMRASGYRFHRRRFPWNRSGSGKGAGHSGYRLRPSDYEL